MSKKLFWAVVEFIFYICLFAGVIEFTSFLMNFAILSGLGKIRATFGFAGIILLLLPVLISELQESMEIIAEPIAIWIVKRRETRK